MCSFLTRIGRLTHHNSPCLSYCRCNPLTRESDVNDFDTCLYITCTERDTLPGISSHVSMNHLPLTLLLCSDQLPSSTLGKVPAILSEDALPWWWWCGSPEAWWLLSSVSCWSEGPPIVWRYLGLQRGKGASVRLIGRCSASAAVSAQLGLVVKYLTPLFTYLGSVTKYSPLGSNNSGMGISERFLHKIKPKI